MPARFTPHFRIPNRASAECSDSRGRQCLIDPNLRFLTKSALTGPGLVTENEHRVRGKFSEKEGGIQGWCGEEDVQQRASIFSIWGKKKKKTLRDTWTQSKGWSPRKGAQGAYAKTKMILAPTSGKGQAAVRGELPELWSAQMTVRLWGAFVAAWRAQGLKPKDARGHRKKIRRSAPALRTTDQARLVRAARAPVRNIAAEKSRGSHWIVGRPGIDLFWFFKKTSAIEKGPARQKKKKFGHQKTSQLRATAN